MSETRWRSLYGHPDGRWVHLEGVRGSVMSPGRIGDLVYLGPADGIVSRVYGWMLSQGSRKRPIQAELAERLGVGQQAISRYDRGLSYPDLTDEGWSELVKAYFEVPDDWTYGDPLPEEST